MFGWLLIKKLNILLLVDYMYELHVSLDDEGQVTIRKFRNGGVSLLSRRKWKFVSYRTVFKLPLIMVMVELFYFIRECLAQL